jgi:hypothetical protein
LIADTVPLLSQVSVADERELQFNHNCTAQRRRPPSTSETYAEFAPDYLGHVQAEITRFMRQVFEGQNWNFSQL